MPKRNVFKRRRPRRYRRRRYKRRRMPDPVRGLTYRQGPLKARQLCMHQYSTYVYGTPTTDYTYFTFRANGMYDPEVAVGGHQPMGFDQMCELYLNWTVIGSKIVVRTASTQQIMVGVRAAPEAASYPAGINDAFEVQGVSDKITGVDGRLITVSKKISPPKFLGYSKKRLDDALKGTSSSDPSEQVYYHVYIGSPFGVDLSATDIYLRIDIQYIAVWTGPRDIIGS